MSDAEVKRRLHEADADPSVLITFDELVAGLRHRCWEKGLLPPERIYRLGV